MVALACLGMRFTEPDLRPSVSTRWQVGISLAHRCLRHHHWPASASCSLRLLNMVEGARHRLMAAGLASWPHHPAKITPSRGGIGCAEPLPRTEPGTTWAACRPNPTWPRPLYIHKGETMSTKYAIVGGKLIDGTGAEPVENSPSFSPTTTAQIEYAASCRTFRGR